MAYIGSLNDRFYKTLIINVLHKTPKNATERLHAQTGMNIGKAQFLYIYTFRTLSLHFLFLCNRPETHIAGDCGFIMRLHGR